MPILKSNNKFFFWLPTWSGGLEFWQRGPAIELIERRQWVVKKWLVFTRFNQILHWVDNDNLYTRSNWKREKSLLPGYCLYCAPVLDAKICNADMAPSLAGSPVTSDDEVTTLLFHETRGMEMKNYPLSRLWSLCPDWLYPCSTRLTATPLESREMNGSTWINWRRQKVHQDILTGAQAVDLKVITFNKSIHTQM